MASLPFKRFVVVEFECHHTRDFPYMGNLPAVGEALWCLRCRRETKVIKHLKEYRVRCSDCPYSRGFGANSLQAEIAASKHHNRYPYHEVKLWHGVDVAHVWARNPDSIFAKALLSEKHGGVDQPPF